MSEKHSIKKTAESQEPKRVWPIKPKFVWMIATGAGILIALAVLFWVFDGDRLFANKVNVRNESIAAALAVHPVKALAGDIHRIDTVKHNIGKRVAVVPLTNCTDPANPADNRPNGADFENGSFAYLITYDHVLKAAPSCTLQQITEKYGSPNTSILISGTLDHPNESLLFYDKGVNKPSRFTAGAKPPKNPSTVVPRTVGDFPPTSCAGDKTVLNIVAHQDDDLLFLSPDLLHDVQGGSCVRTIYLTAGDAGLNQYYWLGREQGSEAAYSYMTAEDDNLWVQRIVKLADKEFLTIATPKNNPKISLIYMHLPDGNVDGSGFKGTNYQSLSRLSGGTIPYINSVDNQSSYTSDQLISALSTLMNYYQPAIIRTQNTQRKIYGNPGLDHTDHVTVGKYAERAFQHYSNRIGTPLYLYIGYPIRQMPANVTPADSQQKTATFLKYARYDTGICNLKVECSVSPVSYGGYINRQYKVTH